MKEKWDERYAQEAYAYGEQPNNYLKEQLSLLTPGTILFPAEGEGRNAVYAASQGWTVFAFDQSSEGKNKAMQLAEKNNVVINYEISPGDAIRYSPNQFDAVALIYAHFPADKKSGFHRQFTTWIRPGGFVILEAFSKRHLEYVTKNEKVGGPRELNMLFSVDEIRSDFSDFEVLQLEELEIELQEGLYHNGKGSVIRFLGRKK